MNAAATPDSSFKLYSHPDNKLISVVCSSLRRCDLSDWQLLFEHLHVRLLVVPDYFFSGDLCGKIKCIFGFWVSIANTKGPLDMYILEKSGHPIRQWCCKMTLRKSQLRWPAVSVVMDLDFSWCKAQGVFIRYHLSVYIFLKLYGPVKKQVFGPRTWPVSSQKPAVWYCWNGLDLRCSTQDPFEMNVHSVHAYVAPRVATRCKQFVQPGPRCVHMEITRLSSAVLQLFISQHILEQNRTECLYCHYRHVQFALHAYTVRSEHLTVHCNWYPTWD